MRVLKLKYTLVLSTQLEFSRISQASVIHTRRPSTELFRFQALFSLVICAAFTSYNFHAPKLHLIDMALPLPSGLTPPETAFLCEMEMVTVIPRQRLEGLNLLGVS